MSDLCKVWVVGFFFFSPFLFSVSQGNHSHVLSVYFIEMFFIEMFFSCFFFFHGGVPACFSVQVRDAVGIGKAHPTALKMEVEDK